MSNPASMGDREDLVVSLDPNFVTHLQMARAYPSVSLLLSTTPSRLPTSRDVQRLDRLIQQAASRLESEMSGDASDRLVARLRGLATRIRRHPAGHGLGLFVSEHRSAAIQLPVPVLDRVVVDPTFATRDLVRALNLSPRHRVLAVSGRSVRLYEGAPGSLREVENGVFPLSSPAPADRRDRGLRFGRERARGRDAHLSAHLRAVDEALAARREVDPLPLVVAGVERHLAICHSLPAIAADLIGTIKGNHERSSPNRLSRLARPVIDAHLAAARVGALAHLVETPPARRADGIDAVWAAAVGGCIDLLCVEEGFVFPARPIADGKALRPASDSDHPEVLDDAVDEIIELVALANGRSVIVEDGELQGSIAAVLRRGGAPSRLAAEATDKRRSARFVRSP